MLRTLAVGLIAAATVWATGLLFQRATLGATDEAAVRLIQTELDARLADTAAALAARVEAATRAARDLRPAARDVPATRALFQRLADLLPEDQAARAGLSVLDSRNTPLAWAGRVSDVPREGFPTGSQPFVLLDAQGPRLVLAAPVPGPERGQSILATVVAEEVIGERTATTLPPVDTFRMSTAVVEVTASVPGAGGRAASGTHGFDIRTPGGHLLVHAEVSTADLAAARGTWRARTMAASLATLALTVLLCAGPLLEVRRHAALPGRVAAATVGLVGVLLAGRLLLRAALAPVTTSGTAGLFGLLPDALLLSALVWLAIDTIERRRVSRPRARLLVGTSARLARVGGPLLAGVCAAGLIWQYERVLGRLASQTSHDLLRFSVHPFDVSRLGMVAALVMLHAAVAWGAAAVLRLPWVLWRTPRRASLRAAGVVAAAGGAAAVAVLAARASQMPMVPLLLAMAAAGVLAGALSRPRGTLRRSSQATRLGLLFAGLVVPALALYPSLDAYAVRSKERLIEGTFAPEVANQREDLQARQLPLALETIDAMGSLTQFVSGAPADAAPATDRAFLVWSQTVLAEEGTTSAVELYGASGALVSRFALNLPEYGASEFRGGSCTDWEVYEEVSPFGTLSTLRNVLRASRAICQDRRRVGGIVVRARLDYHALPFISTQSPYLQTIAPRQPVREEAAFGSDVELVVYGWSRTPLYASGPSVWPLSEETFARMTNTRAPEWARVIRDAAAHRVYFFSDRGGIYALGYPVLTRFGHLVNLAELVFFVGLAYAVLLLGSSAFNALTGQTPSSGRALLREVRSSFYRKLFIAFVASAVVPVVVLAVATSTYVANQFRADVEDSAVKTATVAQRLIEDYVALQERGASLDLVDDEFMLLVRRAIDEDVNLFDGARLQATSERPLFASRLLAARTPAAVYRAIALDRLPTAVVVEQAPGEPAYLVAAAPVRAGAREGIVTVPQTLRQREIEAQIDEIDRRVLSAAVLFVLLGSALGYWMAERIADPVNRLTRATRRIARGDLDARIATTSSDELRRLVQDFNQMASDLKQQRAERERTQRLEAWADMARQVAHDIKNPLTPIQLSAEHARRVNQDRGRPLSPALDECVAAILSQVTLLRQISTEFSSFASSPVPRPERTDMRALLEEVIEPYRTGLASRIPITLDAPADLPGAMVDRTLFSRALTNVIENALHAMPGTGTLDVGLALASGAPGEPPMLAVRVTDSGIGMDADALARIFEPYFSTKATGTGLGLTIAKRNVELLGGRIDVRSERGRGTTVVLTVPVAA